MGKAVKIRLFDYDKTDLFFFGLLVALTLWLFAPGLNSSRMMLPYPDDIYVEGTYGYSMFYEDFIMWDPNLEYQPWNDYACERLKDGGMPFWNPYNLCGTPFFASSLHQLTYIPRLFFSIILPSQCVITALAILHFLLVGIGFFYLLKAYDISPVAAGIATFVLLFKFSHPVIMMSPPLGLTMAYTTLCLLLVIKLIRGGRWLFALYLAVCLSCVISSGYPVYVVHLLYLSLAILIFEFFRLRKSLTRPALGVCKVAFGAVLSILISLTQLLPLVLFSLSSARLQFFGEHLTPFWNPASYLQYVLYQNILFLPKTEGLSYIPAFESGHLYLGIAPLLITLPFLGQWRDRAYSFFLAAGIVAGILTFSLTATDFALQYLPGFGISPSAPIPVFFFCVIAAFGVSLNHILKHRDIPSKPWLAAFFVATIVLTALPLVLGLIKNSFPANFAINYTIFTATSFLIGLGILIKRWNGNTKPLSVIIIIVLLATLLSPMKTWTRFFGPEGSWGLRCNEFFAGRDRYPLDKPRYFNATGTTMLAANINIYPRMRFVQGYDSLVLKHFTDQYQEHIPGGVLWGRRLIALEGETPGDYLGYAGVGKVILNPRYQADKTYEEAVDIGILVREYPFKECSAIDAQCEMHRVNPELIEISIDAGSDTEIRVSETYYPAWRYRIDGGSDSHPARLGEKGFMVIPDITPGQHMIELFYDPWLEKLGLMLAAVSFVIGLMVIMRLEHVTRQLRVPPTNESSVRVAPTNESSVRVAPTNESSKFVGD